MIESGGGGTVLGQALSLLEVSKLAHADSAPQLADDSTDSLDGKYVNVNSESEEDEDQEDEEEDDEDVEDEHYVEELEQHEKDENLFIRLRGTETNRVWVS